MSKNTMIFIGGVVFVIMIAILISASTTRRQPMVVAPQPHYNTDYDQYDQQGSYNDRGVYQQDFYSDRGYYNNTGIFIFIDDSRYDRSYHSRSKRLPTRAAYRKKYPNKKLVRSKRPVSKKSRIAIKKKPVAKKQINLKKKPVAKKRIDLKKKPAKRIQIKKKKKRIAVKRKSSSKKRR